MEGVREVMTDVVAECVAVAAASGVTVAPDILPAVLGLAARPPGHSAHRRRVGPGPGKPTEIDHLTASSSAAARRWASPRPPNRVLHTLVKAAEAATRDA